MVGIGFIGYKQGDEQSGYYPGRGIGGGKPFIPPVPPVEFTNTLEDVQRFIDGVEKEIRAGTIDLPLNVWEQVKRDWLGLFTLGGGYAGQKYVEANPITRELTGETSFPKATDVTYDINPAHILGNPAGWAKNQLKIIKDSAFTLQEGYEMAYDELMQDVILGTRGGGTRSRLRSAYTRAYEENVLQRLGASGTTIPGFDLSLKGMGVYSLEKKRIPAQQRTETDPVTGAVYGTGVYDEFERFYDSGAKLGAEFVNAHRVVQLASKRESATRKLYTELIKTMRDDIRNEVVGNRTEAQVKTLIENTVVGLGYTAGDPRKAQMEALFLQGYEEYKQHVLLADKLNSANGFVIGASLGAISNLKTVAKITRNPAEYSDELATLGRLTPVAGNLESLTKVQAITIKGARNQIQEMDNYFATLPTDPSLLAAHMRAKKAYEDAIRPARNALDDILKEYGGAANIEAEFERAVRDAIDPTKPDFTRLNKVEKSLKRFQNGTPYAVGKYFSGMSGGDSMTRGAHNRYLEHVVSWYILPTGAGTGVVGQMALQNPGELKLGVRAIAHLAHYRTRYNYEFHKDVINTLEGGKFVNNILIRSRIYNRLTQYTPRALTATWLARNSYFGLIVDSERFDPYFAFREGKAATNLTSIFFTPGQVVTYWMWKKGWTKNMLTLDLSRDITGFGGALRFEAGTHLRFANELLYIHNMKDINIFNRLVQRGGGPLPIHTAIDALKGAYGWSDQKAYMYALLNVKSLDEFNTLFKGVALSDPGVAMFYYTNLRAFQEFLMRDDVNNKLKLFKNITRAGGVITDFELDKDNFKNLGHLLEWFNKVSHTANPTNFDFTRNAVGLLEQVTKKLNQMQDWLYTRELGNVQVGKLFFIRSEIVQIVTTKLVTFLQKFGGKLFGGLLTGAVEGGSAVLGGPLGAVATYLITKLAMRLEKAVKEFGIGLAKLQLGRMGQAIEDLFADTGKLLAKVMLAIALILLLPMIFTSSIISNISPIEPFSYNNIEAGITPGPAPPGQLITGACSNGCIFAGGINSEIGSYSGNESGGHGSNNYWDNVPSTIPQCGINIPTNGGGGVWGVSKGPTAALDDSGDNIKNYCRGKPTSTDYYGRAWDIIPTAGAGTTVCAPSMSGVAYWKIGQSLGQYNGFMVDVSGFNAADELVRTIRYVHLGTIVRTGDKIMPGDSVGTVWDWGSNSHVHLEVKDINGSILAPESTGMCAGS